MTLRLRDNRGVNLGKIQCGDMGNIWGIFFLQQKTYFFCNWYQISLQNSVRYSSNISSLGRKNLIWPLNMNTEQNTWWKLRRINLNMFPGLKDIKGFLSKKLGTWNMYETNFHSVLLGCFVVNTYSGAKRTCEVFPAERRFAQQYCNKLYLGVNITTLWILWIKMATSRNERHNYFSQDATAFTSRNVSFSGVNCAQVCRKKEGDLSRKMSYTTFIKETSDDGSFINKNVIFLIWFACCCCRLLLLLFLFDLINLTNAIKTMYVFWIIKRGC